MKKIEKQLSEDVKSLIKKWFEDWYDVGYWKALDEVKRNWYEEANKKWNNFINR